MEMHTSSSLYVTHGIIVQPKPTPRARRAEALRALWARMRVALRHELEVRRAVAEFETFSDRMLADLGISRSDIKHVVRGKRPQLWHHSEDAAC